MTLLHILLALSLYGNNWHCWKAQGNSIGISIIEFRTRQNPQAMITRKTLCPAEETSSLYRFHQDSSKCYKIGDIGPCGSNMMFVSEIDSSLYGDCECDYLENKPYVYHQETDRCYLLYSKAYCGKHEWLAFDSKTENSKTPVCLEDACKDAIIFGDTKKGNPIVHFAGRCVLLNSRNDMCEEDEIVTLKPNSKFPTCGPSVPTSNILPASILPSLFPCRIGSRRLVTGKCSTYNVTTEKHDSEEDP